MGNRTDSFENYFGFGFLLVHTHRDSSAHRSSGVMQEALPNKTVKAHGEPPLAPALPRNQEQHSVVRHRAQE